MAAVNAAESIDPYSPAAQRRAMTDHEQDLAQIDAVINEMYAMISGPAGPRDWSRQANCFHPEARQIRTAIDAAGGPR